MADQQFKPILSHEEFAQALARGRLMGLSCIGCGAVTTPPQATCPKCGGSDLGPVEVEPSGVIETMTVIRVGPAGFDPPYVVALVRLDDGPRLMGRVNGVDPESAGPDLIGRRVCLKGQVSEPRTKESGVRRVSFLFDLT